MSRPRLSQILPLAVLVAFSACAPPAGSGSDVTPSSTSTPFLYVGGGDGKLTRFALDERTGSLSARAAFDGGPTPSFLAVSSNGKFLFAVNEKDPGEVSSFAIAPGSGDLTFLSRTSSGGAGPAHLSLDRTGRWLLVANYVGGTSAVVPVRADGTLGPATDIEASGGKAHYITVSPDNRFVFVPCLEPNYIAQYRFDVATGTLTPNAPATLAIPGANPGPRHMVFHPSGDYAYVMNELTSTVTTLRYDRVGGVLSVVETVSSLPAASPGNTGAEIQIHPSGRFVYSSNRGHNSIAAYAVDQGSGQLRLVGTTPTGGATPRHFSLNESGTMLFVANQRSNNLVAMRVGHDGSLAPIGEIASGVAAPQFVGLVRVPAR